MVRESCRKSQTSFDPEAAHRDPTAKLDRRLAHGTRSSTRYIRQTAGTRQCTRQSSTRYYDCRTTLAISTIYADGAR